MTHDDEPSDSVMNEYMARKAIRDLLREFKCNRFKVEATLSLWLEEEIDHWINKGNLRNEQSRPPHRKTPRRVWFGEE